MAHLLFPTQQPSPDLGASQWSYISIERDRVPGTPDIQLGDLETDVDRIHRMPVIFWQQITSRATSPLHCHTQHQVRSLQMCTANLQG